MTEPRRCQRAHAVGREELVGAPGEWRQVSPTAGNLYCARCGCYVNSYYGTSRARPELCYRCYLDDEEQG